VLATLIAGDLKSLTLTSLSFRTTEVCTSCVAAWLTSLRVSQITFSVILLFPFREHERSTTLRTRYFKVWHTRFLHESEMRFPLSALRSAGVAFLSTTVVGRKRCFLKRYAEKLASRRLIGLSVLQQYKFFYVILRRSTRKSVAEHLQPLPRCGRCATLTLQYPAISSGTSVAQQSSKHESNSEIRAPTFDQTDHARQCRRYARYRTPYCHPGSCPARPRAS
jgi:hypothetical protein